MPIAGALLPGSKTQKTKTITKKCVREHITLTSKIVACSQWPRFLISNSKDHSAHIDLPSKLNSNYIDCVLISAAAWSQTESHKSWKCNLTTRTSRFLRHHPFLPVCPSLSLSLSLIDIPLELQILSNHRKKKKATKQAPQTNATAINITFATDTENPFKNLTKQFGGNLWGSVEPGRWSRETCEFGST